MTDISYWLMKSEPVAYSISDLKKEQTTIWDGIRNYQARNFMRSMKVGDQAFFYHSNCSPPGIVGLMEIIKTSVVDPTQFDPQNKYFDPKSSKESPRWDCVQLKYVGQFKKMMTLEDLKNSYDVDQIAVVRKGNRLSILPIPEKTAKDLLMKLDPID